MKMTEKLRYTTVLSLLLCFVASASAFAPFAGGEDETWREEKLAMKFFEDADEESSFWTPKYEKVKLFFDEENGHWIGDTDGDEQKYGKKYEFDVVEFPTRDTKNRGMLVQRDGMGIRVDTNADGKVDKKVSRTGTIVKFKISRPFPEREEPFAVTFYMELDEWSQKPHWSYGRGVYWEGRIGRTPLYFTDDNMDSFLNIHANDGLIINRFKYEDKYYGGYMSSVVLVGRSLYEIQVDEQGRWFKYRDYEGGEGKVDFYSGFKGKEKPKFVILKTYADPHKPDPNAISIFLEKGRGTVPEGDYEFKRTLLNERCIGTDHRRMADADWRYIDDRALPYELTRRKEKKYFPDLVSRHDFSADSKFQRKNQFVIRDGDRFKWDWGAPFCIHLRPRLADKEGGGGKVLEFFSDDFLFYDSAGVCYYAPMEFKNEGAALPEVMSFEIKVYSPKDGKLVTRNTRYTKGSGGGAGDADPNWVAFQVPIGNTKGVFQIEVNAKSKLFGEIRIT
ncbi:MAG: hypothetical protein U5N86_13665 [Planctomycetota bacterium]|nr:hypothetical protein [Planctomycetota bacterium]